MKRTFMGLAMALALVNISAAKDLGVQGNAWPIIEKDMRELIATEVAQTDWTGPQADLKKSAEAYADNLPKRHLPVVDRTETQWMDPSIVLKSDIQAPLKQPDGSYAWRVLYPKGTRVNPLEKTRPVEAMLFFDGSDEEQQKLVTDILAQEPYRIMPIEAGSGSIKKFSTTLNRPVYYANDFLLTRFQVKYLPTLVYAGSGAQQLYMGVTSFARPFKVADVLGSWPDLNFLAKSAGPKPVKK